MTLQDYKKAVTRLFYDMINADGIIEDEEIVILNNLKSKYGILTEDIVRAHQITTSEAIQILKDWQSSGEQSVEFKGSKYTTANAFADIDALSGCDNDRGINEAKLLAALHLCLLTDADGNPIYDAIPIKYRERKHRFSRKEVIYLSSEYDEKIHEDIKRSKKFIECALAIYGYDFIYLPDVINFLSKKAEDKLLKPILMFSKPLYLKESDDADKFVEDIQKITTESFTKDFVRDAGLVTNLKPCLLIKLKTTTIQEKDDRGEWCSVKYTDFIALPIQESIELTARLLSDSILWFAKEISTTVRRQLNEKLYCKGIHQTLIDYTVGQAVEEKTNKVVIKKWGNNRSPFGIKFEGLRNPFQRLQPKDLHIYLLITLLSISSKSKGMPMTVNSRVRAVFQSFPYEKTSDPYDALASHISNIRKALSCTLSIGEMELYSPLDNDGYYKITINPTTVYIQEEKDAIPVPILDWIKDKRIAVGNRLKNLTDILKEFEG